MALQKATEGQLIELNPEVIDADPKFNARFGLKTAKVKELADKILEEGQLQPIEVTPIVEAKNGHEYRVNFGNYRLAAIRLLNEQGAGLTIKAIVRTTEPGKASVIRNLTENIVRQDLTPMDESYAIKELLKVGVDKMQIRNMFSRPGRKGPASNSWFNTTLGFLDLPVKVQNKIHNGEIEWGGAAVLLKVFKENKENLPETLKELEEARQKAIDREEREEEKFLATLKKADESEKKAQEAQAKLEQAKADRLHKLQTSKDAVSATDKQNEGLIAKAQATLEEAMEKVKTEPSEGAKAVAEAVKGLEGTKKAAERERERAAAALKKLEEKYAEDDLKAKEAVAEAKADKKAADTAKKDKQPGGVAKKKASEKPVGAKEATKAAAAAGASNAVKLTRKEIMEVIAGLKLPGGSGKAESRINQLGVLLESAFDGVLTDKQLYRKLLDLFK